MKFLGIRFSSLLCICAFSFVVSVSAQKHKTEQDNVDKVERVENVPAPEPPPREDPKPTEPPPRNDPPPQNTPPSNSDNDSGNSGSSDNSRGNHGRGNRPPRNGDGSGRGSRHKKDDDDDKKRNKRRDRHRNRDDNNIYTDNNTIYTSSTPAPINYDYLILQSFGLNDVAMPIISDYLDDNEDNFLPYYEKKLTGKYQPLHYSYLFEYSLNRGFYGDNWLFYYEPDLENVFINFSVLEKGKYDKLILMPVGNTIKKANKKFGNKGNLVRPVLVEDLSRYDLEGIFYFNIKKVPRGKYELKLINRTGYTLKHQFTVN